MIIFGTENKEDWNKIVKSFPNWDIYYLCEYAVSLQMHGDGSPCLIYHKDEAGCLAYVVMQSDIAEFQPFEQSLEHGRYYDWSTPYGYGGPLISGNIDEAWMQRFMQMLTEYCREHGIISQFLRYHPLLQNQLPMEGVSDVVYMKKTIYIDTSDADIIMKNMTPNNRNMVRKAVKNQISIIADCGEHLEEFMEIYEATMKNRHAADYYFFDKSYFDFLRNDMSDNTIFFYAVYDGKIISASIFFYNETYMHYHLSGTLPEYRKLAATNLLLTRAAMWAAEHGIKKMHLGGGVECEDSLLTFKKHFNRNGELDFCIGRNIFHQEEYQKLVDLRKQVDTTFDMERPFLIKYRG